MAATNSFTLVGRLASDPKIFSNSDGSHKVAMSIYTRMDFRNRNNQQVTHSVPVEQFIPAKSAQNFLPLFQSNLGEGDEVAVTGHMETQSYTGRDGRRVFELKAVLDTLPTFLESRQTTQARRTEKAAKRQVGNGQGYQAQQNQPLPVQSQPVQTQPQQGYPAPAQPQQGYAQPQQAQAQQVPMNYVADRNY